MDHVMKTLRALGALSAVPSQAVLDSAAREEAKAKQAAKDAILDAAGEHAVNGIRAQAIQSLREWAATSDLDEGESLSDRFDALMVGLADENKDGEISDEEAELIAVGMEAAAGFLASKGVSEEDITAFIDDGDAEAAERVRDLLAGELGDDADDEIDNFVFDAESSESALDSVLDSITTEPKLDAVYRKKLVVRGGKKMRVNRRVAGRVRLSAAQKVAIRKAGRRAHTGAARIRRMRSMKVRRAAGL